METQKLQTYIETVATGSFSEAARQLGLTKSAVSKHVAALEESLGVRLLHRTTRSVTPTEAGRILFERGSRILEALEETRDSLTELQREATGTLRLSAPMDFGRRFLQAELARFAGAHPALSLDVELSDRRVDLVAEGFDVALRIGTLTDSSLIARRIATCRRVLVASPSYLAERGRPKKPKDLAKHDKIAFTFEAERSWVLQENGRKTSIDMPVRHRANNGDLICALAAEGAGITMIPTFIACDYLRRGDLVTILDRHIDSDLFLFAVYPDRRLLTTKVRLLIDHLVDAFSPTPPWEE